MNRGFKDFLYANALDDKHFSSNAGDAIARYLYQTRDICSTISVPSAKTV